MSKITQKLLKSHHHRAILAEIYGYVVGYQVFDIISIPILNLTVILANYSLRKFTIDVLMPRYGASQTQTLSLS